MRVELGSDDCYNCAAFEHLGDMGVIEDHALQQQASLETDGFACTLSEGSFVCSAAQRAMCNASLQYPRLEIKLPGAED